MSSPHIFEGHGVSGTMFRVMAALVPGIVFYVIAFGPSILISLTIASLTALAVEAAMIRLRAYPVKPFVTDGSVLLTAWLLALSIPPMSPWWLIVVGTVIAVVFAKHLFGGLGNNLFNPAMVGFAALMISFPAYMTHWPAPTVLAGVHLGFGDQLAYMLTGALPAGMEVDAINMATPLDTLKTQLHLHHTVSEVLQMPIFDVIGGKGSMWIAAMYLLGGIYLWRARIISLHIPLAFLGGLFLMGAFFYLKDADHYVAPWFHLATGGTMLGAFFIATDPVTAAATPRGKLIFGFAAGALTYVIRVLGGYPDGVAFSVLILNAFVPLIDTYTQPRVFGHLKNEEASK
jgi:electron transport complex, RnfABCDGE type, D subunit